MPKAFAAEKEAIILAFEKEKETFKITILAEKERDFAEREADLQSRKARITDVEEEINVVIDALDGERDSWFQLVESGFHQLQDHAGVIIFYYSLSLP